MSRTRSSRAIGGERGWALVTAMIVMGITLAFGLAALSLADFQTAQSGRERVGESSFNLSEGTLSAQLFVLSQRWPGTALGQYPSSCVSTGPADARCPEAARISASFNSPDYAADTSWSTIVRDNNVAAGTSPSYFYDEAVTSLQPAWDANADGRVWVRSRAVVRGKRRSLVALVKVEKIQESFPRSVLTAGRFSITPSGKQTYIDTGGSNVQVRCFTALPDAQDDCAGYEPAKGQIAPENVTYGYQGGSAIRDDALTRFKRRAQAEGTYCGPEGVLNTAFCNATTKCPLPASMNRPGGVIYAAPGDDTLCNYAANIKPCCNTEAQPGLLIFEDGRLEIAADISFWGLIYMANKQGSSDPAVLALKGGMTLYGAAIVDGAGGFVAGSNGLNVVYKENVFNGAISYGTAGIIRNTFREIPG